MKNFNLILFAFAAAILFAGCERKPAEKAPKTEPKAEAKVEQPTNPLPNWTEGFFGFKIDEPWKVKGIVTETSDWGYKTYYNTYLVTRVDDEIKTRYYTTVSDQTGCVLDARLHETYPSEAEAREAFPGSVKKFKDTYGLVEQKAQEGVVILEDPKFPGKTLRITLYEEEISYRATISPRPVCEKNETQGLPIEGAFGLTLGKTVPENMKEEDIGWGFKPLKPLPIFTEYLAFTNEADQSIRAITAFGERAEFNEVTVSLRKALENRYNMEMERILKDHFNRGVVFIYRKGQREIELSINVSEGEHKLRYLDYDLQEQDIIQRNQKAKQKLLQKEQDLKKKEQSYQQMAL